MWEWTSPAGFFVGVLSVLVSAGAWRWAWRAEGRAGKAQDAANEAKQAIETLAQRFERDSVENPDVIVLRIGNGASVINKTSHRLDSVLVAPEGSKVHMNDWPWVGALAAGAAGAVQIAEIDPLWRDASQACVYWVNEAGHRRFNLFPIVDVGSAELNGLVP